MKTPEQIAHKVIQDFDDENQTEEGARPGFGILADEDLVEWMAAAIEADRAQREQIDLEAFITEYEAYQGDDVSYFIHAWQSGYWVADRIAELTAEWEDATGDTAENYALSGDDWRVGLGNEEAAEIVRLIDYQKEGRA